jgi:hypothetical protein
MTRAHTPPLFHAEHPYRRLNLDDVAIHFDASRVMAEGFRLGNEQRLCAALREGRSAHSTRDPAADDGDVDLRWIYQKPSDLVLAAGLKARSLATNLTSER